MACREFRDVRAGGPDRSRKPHTDPAPPDADPDIAAIAAYLLLAHGAEAEAIADAVCASAEAAGNSRQATLWREIRGALAGVAGADAKA